MLEDTNSLDGAQMTLHYMFHDFAATRYTMSVKLADS